MTGRVYGGKSASERDSERRSSLLGAGLDLVGERGVSDLTVADVCTRAGLSRRYFYEQFSSVHELVGALMDQAVESLTASVFAPMSGDETERAHDRVERFVRSMATDRRLARLILIETLGGGALADRRHDLVHRAVSSLLEDFLAPDAEPGRVGADDRRRLAAYALSGATSELLVAWVEGDIVATEDEIVDLLTDLFAHAATINPR